MGCASAADALQHTADCCSVVLVCKFVRCRPMLLGMHMLLKAPHTASHAFAWPLSALDAWQDLKADCCLRRMDDTTRF